VSFKETNFADDVGVPMDTKTVPQEARDYLFKRGHTVKGTKAANLRYVEGERIAELFPASSVGMDGVDKKHPETWHPRWGIVLPYPDDPSFAVARIEYEIKNLGKTDGPAKFLTPTGREVLPYVPPMVSRKDLLNPKKPLYIVESQFKSVVAAINGVPCIGVSGHSGAFEPDTGRTKIRAQLHEYMQRGREVVLLTDADVHGNLEVRRSLLAFMDIAEKDFGCKPVYTELPDLGGGKTGIDDYFAAGHKLKGFDKLPRHARTSKMITKLRCAFFDLTEIGLAQRFEAQHGEDCRHDPKADQWYTWTTGGYCEGTVEPHARVIQTVATLADETAAAKSPADKAARLKFSRESAKLHAQNAATTLAGRFPSMWIDAAQFDADSNLLGVKNGILDLSTGKRLEPNRDLMVTKSAACSFDAKATAPTFIKFIDTAANGDKDLRRHIQEIVGAALLGRSIRTKLHLMYGPAGSGKTTLMEIALALLGDYGMASKADLLLRQGNNTDAEKPSPFLKTLRGRRLVTCSELAEGVMLNDALIKDLLGADTITARGLHEAPITFRNTAAIWIRGNHLPMIGADGAMRERVSVVPFEHVIDAAKRDKMLADQIIANELPGVLNWALVGMRRYVARGYEFQLPAVVVKATEQMQRNSDIIGLWLTECVEIDVTKIEAPWREDAKSLVSSYRDWAAQNGHKPKSTKTLYGDLRRRYGFDEKWPMASSGKYIATGCKLLRDPAVPNIVDTYLAANKEIADQLAKAREEIAALKAARKPMGNTSAKVIDINTRRQRK
jgi:P4 family phage/plasmid primase-like protien